MPLPTKLEPPPPPQPRPPSKQDSSTNPTQDSGTTGPPTATTNTLTGSTPTDQSPSFRKKSLSTKSPESPGTSSRHNSGTKMSHGELGESQSTGSVSVFKIKSQIERLPQIMEDIQKTKKRTDKTSDTTENNIREKSSKSTKSQQSLKQKLVVIEDSVANKTLTVNPDCYKQLLVDYIYEEAQIPKSVIMDLADENGCLINIESLQACDKASMLMDHKRYYVVTFNEHDENGQLSYVEPMMYKINRQDTDFLMRFNRNNPLFSIYVDRGERGSFSKSLSSQQKKSRKNSSVSKKSVATF